MAPLTMKNLSLFILILVALLLPFIADAQKYVGTYYGNGVGVTNVPRINNSTTLQTSIQGGGGFGAAAIYLDVAAGGGWLQDNIGGHALEWSPSGVTISNSATVGTASVLNLRSIQTGNTNALVAFDGNGQITNVIIGSGITYDTSTRTISASGGGGGAAPIGGSMFNTESGTSASPRYHQPFSGNASTGADYVSYNVGSACVLSNLWVSMTDAGGTSATFYYFVCTNNSPTSATFTRTHLMASVTTAIAGGVISCSNTMASVSVGEGISITLMATNDSGSARTIYGAWSADRGR